LILSVGSTTRRKGHDVLLRALARIADRPWQAVIVGAARDAELAQKLAQLAAELRIADRLRFAGSVSAAELGALYRAASVFALATRHEGHGIVFDEAMVHGLPIVSCSVGAVPETVAAGAGRLVPVDDPEAFAQALHELLGDDALRETMAAASRRAGTELPAWVETASIVAAVIDRVAARG
jgi:glycosyltransferase involved in cell wall biosynthesis